MRSLIETGLSREQYREKHGDALPVSSYEVEMVGANLNQKITDLIPDFMVKMRSIHGFNGTTVGTGKEAVTTYEVQGLAEYSVDFSDTTLEDVLSIALANIRTRIRIQDEVADVIPAALPKAEKAPRQSVKAAKESGVQEGMRAMLLKMVESGQVTKEFAIAQFPDLADKLS